VTIALDSLARRPRICGHGHLSRFRRRTGDLVVTAQFRFRDPSRTRFSDGSSNHAARRKTPTRQKLIRAKNRSASMGANVALMIE